MPPDERTARELLDYYLKIISFWLPRAQRRDVVAELEGEIRAQVAEQERDLGRSLTEAEMEDLLDRWGHPMQVAGRYAPRRHLIGPEVFPLYVLALKVVALVYLVPWLLVWLGLVLFSPAYRASHPGFELVETLGTLPLVAVWSFTVLTLLFALLERSRARTGVVPEWNPRRHSRASGARA